MQYAKDVTIDSKFGFQITFSGKLQDDTVSLLIDGITVVDKVIFPPAKTDLTDYTDDNSFATIDIDNKKLSRRILGVNYESIAFPERREIELEVIKGQTKYSFQVDLKKGRFLYIEDLFYYGDTQVKRHIIAKSFEINPKPRKENQVDYSKSNEVIRIIQYKKAPAVF